MNSYKAKIIRKYIYIYIYRAGDEREEEESLVTQAQFGHRRDRKARVSQLRMKSPLRCFFVPNSGDGFIRSLRRFRRTDLAGRFCTGRHRFGGGRGRNCGQSRGLESRAQRKGIAVTWPEERNRSSDIRPWVIESTKRRQ